MRVVHVTRLDSGFYWGGGEIQAVRTIQSLQSLGVEACHFEPMERNFADIYHFFGNFEYYEDIAEHLRTHKIPYVVSPIFVTPRTPKRLKWRRTRQQLQGQFPHKSETFLQGAKELYTLTKREEENLASYFQGLPSTIRVPNGVESRFANADPSLFRAKYQVEGPFVLQAGTIDRSKNQLALIKAAGSDIPVIILGRESDARYASECKSQAGPNVRFLGSLPHESELFASAVKSATTFCLPSKRELFPLSAMEATVAGCNLVLSNRWNGEEIWGEDATFVDPDDIPNLRSCLQKSLNKGHEEATQRRVNAFLEKYDWQAVAHQILDRYKYVLGSK